MGKERRTKKYASRVPGSPPYSNYLGDYWPYAGGLSAVNVFDKLGTDLMAADDIFKGAVAEGERKPVSKYQRLL